MEVKFKDVSFSYDDRTVFSNFSCSIKSNIITAIIGASGSGKSTMLDLLDDLVECDNGSVMIGSCEVSRDIRKK